MTEKETSEARPVYAITERGQERSFWTRVGVAHPPNRDGSINLTLDALPVSGKLQIRAADAGGESRPERRHRG